MKTVLVTGGAGYVGSHCCKEFAANGWTVVTLDNLSRGWREAVKWGPLIEADIADKDAVVSAIQTYQPDLIAHFAAFAYVGESVSSPHIYYENNVVKTLALLEAARSVRTLPFLFSSTCATYGHPQRPLIDETHPQQPINPYGWTKLVIEQMLKDYAAAYAMPSIALRYFNAAGADPDGEIGEHHVPETHAIPLAIEAALGHGGSFNILGTDFDTPDGSCVRDYIHVKDLARAHVAAGERLLSLPPDAEVYNLGTGKGTSVIELIAAAKDATGNELTAQIAPRRVGDPAMLVADPGKAAEILGWRAEHSSIDEIMRTAVAWRRKQHSQTA